MLFKCRIQDAENRILASAEGEGEIYLVYNGGYSEGDSIVMEAQGPAFVVLQFDDVLGEELVYLKNGTMSYRIPFGEKKVCYSPRSFTGEKHLITAREAREEEIAACRNLARNKYDQHGDTGCFPHASANVETRGEAVFAARNAIDGIKANDSHGEWPYGSWGINRNPDAVIRVEFGRSIQTDKIGIYLRADFPHDSWWTEVTVRFSDDSVMVCPLRKTGGAQIVSFAEKQTEWIQLERLIKAEDPSPFPALTQLEVYGTESKTSV